MALLVYDIAWMSTSTIDHPWSQFHAAFSPFYLPSKSLFNCCNKWFLDAFPLNESTDDVFLINSMTSMLMFLSSHREALFYFILIVLLWLQKAVQVDFLLVPRIDFCFVGLPFFPSASWPLSFLSLFFFFFQPGLIHARMPERSRDFVHGHTFLHSWSGPMTLVVGLLHGATLLSNLPLVLFVSFIGPRYGVASWWEHLLNPEYILIITIY